MQRLNRDRYAFELRVVGPPLTEEERREAKFRRVLRSISVFSGLSTPELRAMYSDAFALLYLSRYEGFGLPILEAQQCGCPVIALNNPASREVGQQGVLFLDNTDVRGINEIVESLADEQQRRLVVSAGLQNAKRYDWDLTVDKLIQVYDSHLNESSGGSS